MNIARVFRNTRELVRSCNYGKFDGNLLIIKAEKNKTQGWTPTERWKPFVTGSISEVRLPVAHSELFQPEALRAIWSATSVWLGWTALPEA